MKFASDGCCTFGVHQKYHCYVYLNLFKSLPLNFFVHFLVEHSTVRWLSRNPLSNYSIIVWPGGSRLKERKGTKLFKRIKKSRAKHLFCTMSRAQHPPEHFQHTFVPFWPVFTVIFVPFSQPLLVGFLTYKDIFRNKQVNMSRSLLNKKQNF